MSAICGIYNRGGRQACSETGAAMLDGFSQYHADNCDVWLKDEVFMACHAQHITPESVDEKLPYYDEQADLAITADAIIDNRRELFDRLSIPHEWHKSIPDSQLILEAYKKWGKDCPKYLIGDFAFAIWDGRLRELFCAVDALGTRTLYYSHNPGLFAFSTLMKPLFVVPEIDEKFNDLWIADFLATTWVMHQLDPEITIYEGIYLLPAGHTLSVTSEGINKTVYWEVTRQPEIRRSSDDEYVQAFLEVFGEAVRCRLRSIRPVGVMMSGGLDSTSVACMAARELAQRGQRLQAFSAVPMEGYHDWLPATQLADETSFIEAVKQYAGNIDIMYCQSEGKHSLSDTSRIFTVLEHPYKIFENLFWIESILSKAQERSIGVLLDGGAGNATISWGDINAYAVDLVRQGKWSLLWREAKAYAVRRQRPFGKVLAKFLLNGMPYAMQKTAYMLRYGSKYDSTKLSPINYEFAQRCQVGNRYKKFDYDPLFVKELDSFTCRRAMVDTTTSSHVGSINTKQSLAYRVAARDPTLDKRVIEFCLSLPEDQYVRDGKERCFIRRAMEGILPDKVRLNDSLRGRQSADWLQRLQPYWQNIVAEIKGIGEYEAERRYLDIDRIQRSILKIGTPSGDMADDDTVRMLMRSVIFSRFLSCHDKVFKGR